MSALYLDTLVESTDNVLDVVVSGRYGATRLWAVPPYEDVQKARRLLRELGLPSIRRSGFASTIAGRAPKSAYCKGINARSGILTFDEPCAPLDLKARESFLTGIEAIARDKARASLSMIYVTHRIDDIPRASPMRC